MIVVMDTTQSHHSQAHMDKYSRPLDRCSRTKLSTHRAHKACNTLKQPLRNLLKAPHQRKPPLQQYIHIVHRVKVLRPQMFQRAVLRSLKVQPLFLYHHHSPAKEFLLMNLGIQTLCLVCIFRLLQQVFLPGRKPNRFQPVPSGFTTLRLSCFLELVL
jgi:hypothetical protein